jgi:GT2 family glycosyltransferase
LLIVDPTDTNGDAEKCVESVRRLTIYSSYDIVIADPTKPYPERLNHIGLSANADVLVFLQGELEVKNSDWLRELVSQAIRREVGVVGGRLWYADDTLQHSGYILGLGEVASAPHRTASRGHAGFFNRTYLQRDCSAVSIACLAMRQTVFAELGGLDTKNLTGNYHDIDFCLRVREHGLRVIWTPYADLVFRNCATGNSSEETPTERRRSDADYMRNRWGGELRADPFYSLNLSLALPGFELAFPPRWFGAA